MKVVALVDVAGWSVDNCLRGLAKHSRHEITVMNSHDGTSFYPADVARQIRGVAGTADIFHVNWTGDWKWLRDMAGAPKTPMLLTLHSSIDEWAAEECLGIAHKVVAVSKRVRDTWVRLRDDIRVIHNGVDADFWNPEGKTYGTKGPLQVGFFGNKRNPKKNWEMLLSILNDLEGVALVTDSQHQTALEMRDLYWRSDVYLNLSYEEGCCCTLQEAMACGTPAIVTAVGANDHFVDEKCGIVIPPKGFGPPIKNYPVPVFDPEKIKEAIVSLRDHRRKLSHMGKAARKKMEAYTWKEAAALYDDVYDSF